MKKKSIDETMKVTATHMNDINALKLVDPRTDKNCNIFFEKVGRYVSNGKVYKGSYIVYNTPSMQKSFAGVFVSEELREDGAMEPVILVAMDPIKARVVNRTSYRMRVSEKKIAHMFETGEEC